MEVDVTAAVVADVFEQGSSVPAALRRLGAQVAVEPLAAGDYRIRGGILIERKTVAPAPRAMVEPAEHRVD